MPVAPSPFEDLPTDASMRLLAEIHDLTVRSNELVGMIQAFQNQQLRLSGVGLLESLQQCKLLLKEQTGVMVELVERQCQLDDQLRAMTAHMDSSSE